jgi:hypothetical protein
MADSKKFSLNQDDYKKILKGAAIAFGGAALSQLSFFLTSGSVFDWKVWLTAMLAVGINAAIKYIQEKN